MSDDIVERLARLDACALSDALDKLGLPGAVSGIPQRSGRASIAGRCITVKLVARDEVPPSTGPPRHLGTTAIEAGGPGTIIVIEQRTGIDAASWGGTLSLAASLRKIEGVVVDGPVRDVDDARKLGFTVFARTATPITARGRIAEAATNVAVRIGEVTVEAGDYAFADNSGVVFVQAADVERVLILAEDLAGREAAMAEALRAGAPITTVMGVEYETLLAQGAERTT